MFEYLFDRAKTGGFGSDPRNGEMFTFISEPHMQESSCINPLVTTAFRD